MAARLMPGVWLGRRADADDHFVAIGPNKVICTRACKMLPPTIEPVEDYKYAKNLLQTWMEPVDGDVRIVFSGRAEVDTEESKKGTPEFEEGLPALPRRVRTWLQPTMGCPACENQPFGVRNARCRKRKAEFELKRQ
eukprot:6275797-Heterocapsa_arctica.AAC.1